MSRVGAFTLLAMANLLWAGNWVTGRAIRDSVDPLTLNFWRWLLAALVLAPLAVGPLWVKRGVLRRDAGLLLLYGLLGAALFHYLVYRGLATTTAVNGVLLNSSLPLFVLVCAFALERAHATARQVAGMLASIAGILVIVSRGDFGNLLALRLQGGDLWVLAAMPAWALYSVLLERRPPELGGIELLFVISAGGVIFLLPPYAAQLAHAPLAWPGTLPALGVLYTALAASVGAYICYNRGVQLLGAATAGFTLHLLPVFGTLLAIALLGEAFGLYHAVGIATILAGVVLATRKK